MLKHIAIRDYAIVESLDLDLGANMTVVTGETGAGKSIMLDALALCVGDRADSRTVRPGAKRADISALFDLSALPEAKQWLAERELDDDTDECLLRRTVSSDGRSKAYINGTPATLADCAALGELLVDIHSQHAHQSLLRKVRQRELLDAWAGASALAGQVGDTAREWQQLDERYQRLSSQSEADLARRDLLRYQVTELDELDLRPGEIERLESEQKQLANAGYLLESASAAAEGCDSQTEQVSRLRALMDDGRHDASAVANIRELLSSAEIALDEAKGEIERYLNRIDIDPERLSEVESRLDDIYQLARKHRVNPEQLLDHHEQLSAELAGLDGGDEQLDSLRSQIAQVRTRYEEQSKKLSAARKKGAKGLAKRVMEALERLAMAQCQFQVALVAANDDRPSPRGSEDVEFLISTNPGSEPGSLARIASGGELSRISLALQVAAADNVTAPTMIFDEVDVGIGGAVAEVVGELLRQLGERVQVLCVTHLPQVAAQGQRHLKVMKSGDSKRISTQITLLDREDRVNEIARMLGGKTITESTLNHAREMLGTD